MRTLVTRSRLAIITVFTASLLGPAALATTRSYNFSAILCHQDKHGIGPIEYSQYGVDSPVDTWGFGAFVDCGIPLSTVPTSGDVTEIDVFAYDRNSLPGREVYCTFFRTDIVGNIVYQTTLQTSGSGPTEQQLVAHPPAGTGVAGYWSADCQIPPPASANQGVSYLVAFRFAVNE